MTSLQPFLAAIQSEIDKTVYGESPIELYEPIDYIMELGGKRMRPALTLIAANLFSDNWQSVLKPAVAVEVFHNFTLMHDDIMDAAPLRRGQATVHEKWSDDVAILSGDVMLVAAYELLTTVEDKHFKRVVKRFNRTAAEVCEGQQFDMNFATRDDVTEEEYLNMIRLKTSVLLGFALELGGIISDADDKTIELLYETGVNMGLGFQLKDDLLDVYGDPEKFGKQVGGDIIENKKTWLLLKALEKSKSSSPELYKELQSWISTTGKDAEKVEAVTEIYNKLEIKAAAENVVSVYFEKGLNALKSIDVEDERKLPLKEFAAYLMARES
ncbi:MAG: geranylgeranyl diphosphate synthase type II [Spirosomataceae bacterium]|jgi:geranylgeranyl diphosphate synthase type II